MGLGYGECLVFLVSLYPEIGLGFLVLRVCLQENTHPEG